MLAGAQEQMLAADMASYIVIMQQPQGVAQLM
jgi:hypothetical protein